MRSAGHLPHYRCMSLDLIQRRVRQRLAELNLDYKAASRKAGLGETFVRDLLERGREPRVGSLIKLAEALEVSAAWLQGIESGSQLERVNTPFIYFPVVGQVQAGLWCEATQWPTEDWQHHIMPRLDEHSDHFGLVVKGDSMADVYDEGTILLCVRLSNYNFKIESGDHVIVERRLGDLAECTVKEYFRDASGKIWLRPKCEGNPAHQPIPLPEVERFDDGGAAPVEITAVVVADIHPHRAANRS